MTQVAGTSLTDAYPILKEYYADQKVRNLLERRHTLWAMLTKDTNVSGRTYPQPMRYGASTGSANFTNAQNNQSPNDYAEFQVPINTNYTLATVQNVAIQAARNDKGAFINLLKDSIDGAMENAIRRDAWMAYRTGTGSIGVIGTSADIATGIIILTNPTDALAFQRNQVLVANSADGGGTTRAGIGYVISSDVSTGTIQVSATAGGSGGQPSGWVAGDYLSSQGDVNAQIQGLGIWFPSTSTLRPVIGTPSIFLGVDRSVDPTRLAGTFLNLTGLDIESALIELISQVKMVGGSPDYVFVNTVSYRNLQKALQARSQYDKVEVVNDAGLTFKGIEVDGAVVLEDSDCPPKTAYALQMDTLKVISFGDSPQILTYDDGITAFRTANNDSVEARIGGYRNMTCNAPVKNGVALLPV